MRVQLPAATWRALTADERAKLALTSTCMLADPAWFDASGVQVDTAAKAVWAVWDSHGLDETQYPRPFRRIADETDAAEVKSGRAPDVRADRPIREAITEVEQRKPVASVPVLDVDLIGEAGAVRVVP